MREARDHASTRWLRRALGRVATLAHNSPIVALALAAALTAGAGVAASSLRIDTDLTNLLPKSFESVRDLEKLEQRFWGIGYIVVVGQGADVATLERFADELAPELAAVEGIEYVDYQRPTAFFEEHALYFLPTADLETVAERLAAREAWERRRNNPMYIDMEDGGEEAPTLDFSDLQGTGADDDGEWRRAIQGTTPYYVDPDGKMIVLMAKPAYRASRLQDTKTLVTRVERFLAERAGDFAARYGPELKVSVTGRHKKRIDQQSQISGDLARGSLLALGLVLLYVFLHFRRASAVLVVMAPLVLGLAWAFGFASLAIGILNILTGFIGALLTGLGIDHGIHLLARYDELRAHGASPADAIAETFEGTGHAVLVAGLTTTASFVALSTSEFRAFSEFGVIAAAGLVLVVLSYTVVLPALLALVDRRPERAVRPAPVSPLSRALPRWAPVFFWLFVVGGAWLFSQADRLSFDPDLASLEDSDLESFRLDKEVNRILGYSQTPVIALTPDAASERAAAAALRQRKAERGEASGIDFVGSVADMVPPDQAAKREILRRIDKTLARVKPKWLEPEDRERLADLRRMAAAEPFTRATLPIEVRRQFEGPGAGHAGAHDGSGFVLVFPSVSLSDGQAVRRFADEVRGIHLDGERLVVSGEGMILADVFALVSREAEPVLLLTALLVFATLWILLGSLGDALSSAVPAVAQMALLAGLLPLAFISLNPLNIVMIPVLFGMGIDGGVHLVTRLRAGDPPGDVFNETGRAITGSVLTTILGFGALALANHPGIRSIGLTAIYGLLVGLLTCLVLLPSLLTMIGFPRRSRRTWRDWIQLPRLRRALVPTARALATVGRAGDAPIAPGTLGALAALPFAWLLADLARPLGVAALVALTVASVVIVDRYLRSRPAGGSADPSEVVLDEFVGVLIALAFVPWEPLWILAAFVLFRAADIVKPWPVGLIDRRVHGGLGVMGDDVVAGLMAGLALCAVRCALPVVGA